jgi:hypothetical protein
MIVNGEFKGNGFIAVVNGAPRLITNRHVVEGGSVTALTSAGVFPVAETPVQHTHSGLPVDVVSYNASMIFGQELPKELFTAMPYDHGVHKYATKYSLQLRRANDLNWHAYVWQNSVANVTNIISSIETDKGVETAPMAQTMASSKPGCSGSPVCSQGRIIGIWLGSRGGVESKGTFILFTEDMLQVQPKNSKAGGSAGAPMALATSA